MIISFGNNMYYMFEPATYKILPKFTYIFNKDEIIATTI